MASEQCRVMVFPWLAFGHMIPFLEFSKRLAAKGIFISFVSTPRNIQRLPPISPDLEDKIKMVEIPLPSIDGLPKSCEATIDLQLEQIQYLKKACDDLKAPFEELLKNHIPDFILFDFIHSWIPETAAKFGIGSAFFSVYTAATLAYLGPPSEMKSQSRRTRADHFTVPPDWFTFPSLVVHSANYSPTALQNLHFPDKSGMSSGQRMAKTVEGSDFIVVRSCKEFEGEYLDLLEELYQIPVLPIGLLPPNLVENRTSNTVNNSIWSGTFKWLDKHKSKSVVFVGFGSEYKMPLEQIHELAHGLELSKLPFIWVLRKPEGIDSLKNLLPPGFLTRISDRGMVSLGWAPQLEILAHPAIGGCLFHSGWGSIIESLGFGHPAILLPMVRDQELNAKLLVEKGIGHEVPRNKDGSFDRDVVAESVRLVMVEEEGELLRAKTAKMQTVFSSQDLHDSYINKFIEYLNKFKKRELQISTEPNREGII
ncbi:hypothetical protein U1Q18_035276 [Sarracenia purpurea var. burkii]